MMWEAMRPLAAVTRIREPGGMMASGRVLARKLLLLVRRIQVGGYGVVRMRRGLVG